MAGLGFKDFAVGEVLTAADVDGYLMQQSVMRFADAGARGSALGTAAGTGVPLAEGMVSYLDDVNQVQVFDGTSWASTGKMRQVLSATKTDTFSTTSTTFTDVTGLTASITPNVATNKVLVIASLNLSAAGQGYATFARLARDGTGIFVGDTAGSRVRSSTSAFIEFSVDNESSVIVFLDSPATTSSTTYSVQIATNDGAIAALVNRTRADTDSATFPRTASSITLIEVVA